MSTGHELIEAALRRIGRLGTGDSASAGELANGVLEFNRMLSNWSATVGPIYAETTESLTWASGQASRTIGSGGNLDTARPIQILRAALTVSAIDYDLDLITHQEYQAKQDKSTTSELPTQLAYNPSFASSRGALYMYPVPSAAVTLLLTSKKPITDIVGASAVTFPPGYDDAFVLELTVRFADGEYAANIPDSLRQMAIDAKAALIRLNDITEPMYPDPMAPGFCATQLDPVIW